MFFCYVFLFLFVSTTLALAWSWACTSSGSSGASRCFPQRFRRVFVFLFLRLVALRVSSGLVGFPLPRFLFPLPLWLLFLLGWWVPLAAFSRLFPHVSWVGGGVCFCFSCYLLHLASRSLRSRIGQHGLPTRKPPGPPHPVPWRVCPYPSPAGS